MARTEDVLSWTTTIKSRKGADVRLLFIQLHESVQPTPAIRQRAAQVSHRIPTVFKCLGGLCELYSMGKMLKRYDQYEKFEIAQDGHGVKVVERLYSMPFETKKALVQSTPLIEPYVHHIDRSV